MQPRGPQDSADPKHGLLGGLDQEGHLCKVCAKSMCRSLVCGGLVGNKGAAESSFPFHKLLKCFEFSTTAC